ncbi:hypothetical protein DHD32_12945 [Arenibacter sp. TNZ]|jgi:hypothetical protein|uniref:type IV toxin-antitoxin system AbiEi family antitoxin n=1 Tax=Arenibacter TaxID=178469 RepID=UPI000CD42307|nr:MULTISPECIES: type IV toxin-antitoxin system AbiEi family antitoxin [Arenibacter]MCM4172394.1 hypothetical protein [Arenibacter sp. TNZ]
MNDQGIVQYALANLQKTGKIEATWLNKAPNEVLDGTIALTLNDRTIKLGIEIKKELRNIHLPKLEAFAKEYHPFMIVAQSIFPKIKQELRKRNIAYLEANGNIYLNEKETFLWLDANETIAIKHKTTNRAFTKTGLKVVYQFLLDDTWVNNTYREIADKTDTGIGTITNIFNGLKDDGFLIPLTKDTYIIDNKKKLLEKWIMAYEKKLKPNLAIGTYRFADNDAFFNWKDIKLKQVKTLWGGEPAGDIYTNYLRPEELTLYTTEPRNELMKNYRLVPHEGGNVKVYEKFWKDNTEEKDAVHPLLAYADLIMKGDRRCAETAEKIYYEYLQDKF